jgi:hypothetical protein
MGMLGCCRLSVVAGVKITFVLVFFSSIWPALRLAAQAGMRALELQLRHLLVQEMPRCAVFGVWLCPLG